ncbi:MAG: DUF3530 family protein [Cycloclasticus sp.]|nr:DUF3530 family protein [Cycloclasticus sp.]
MRRPFLLFLALTFSLLLSPFSLAADLEREKRIAENIKNSIIIGEVVTLKAGGTEFLALIDNEEPEIIHGSVIILHGMGSNPNAPHVIHPLRSQLADLGWVTAAIQLPLASKNSSIEENLALIKESAPRIQAALSYMQENYKNRPCVIVAHSLGAMMATSFIAEQKQLTCDALVLIGLPSLPSDLPEANSIELLKSITIPILDIYGSQDLASVTTPAPIRKSALMKNNPLNRQTVISGANHAFSGLEETLSRSIHSWLTYRFKPTNNQ